MTTLPYQDTAALVRHAVAQTAYARRDEVPRTLDEDAVARVAAWLDSDQGSPASEPMPLLFRATYESMSMLYDFAAWANQQESATRTAGPSPEGK